MSEIAHSQKKPMHGGNVSAAANEFGLPEEQWIDLSTGINSINYPNTQLNAETFRMLPKASSMDSLLERASIFYKVNSNSRIIAGAGTQSILQILPSLLPNRIIYILTPTYSEHEYTWEKAGSQIFKVKTLNAIPNDVIAVVVNPNNPDGQRHQVKDLLKLSKKVELLIVDEAFCDNEPNLSIIPHLAHHKILVLRSLGKFFGLAGLRLGFAIGMPEITKHLAIRLGPWAVSGPAAEIGRRALADTAWISKMEGILYSQSLRLNNLLRQQNLSIVGGTSLFTLIKTNHAYRIYNALAKKGILIRRFEDYKTWLRIGLPGPENEWEKLECILDSTLNTINDMRERT